MDKKKTKKLIIFAVATIIALILAIIPPFTGLEKNGMIFLGIFIWWITMMSLELIPTYMCTLAALVLAVATGVATSAQAFGSFGGTTAWLLIGAFGLAGGLGNSGLMKRLALNVIKLFPGSYKGQVIGIAAASTLVAPCIPSTAAKCSILVPLVGIVSDELGYAPHSKGAVGLFCVTNTITNFAGVMFLTGGLIVPSVLAISGASITWLGWFKSFWLWGLVLIVLTVLFTLFYYDPKKDGENSTLDKKVLAEKCKELGPLSGKEKLALVVLIITVLLWVTEGKLHSIPTFAVALGAWIVLTAGGLFSYSDFCNKILWSVYVLVGAILGMITLLNSTGVAGWLGGFIAPVVSGFADKGVLILIIIAVVAGMAMFAMVQAMITGTLFITLLAGCGIDPMLIAFITFMSASVFVLNFQQVTVISALGVSGGRVEHKDIVPSAWAYIISQMIAMLISVPWWKFIGLM